MYQHMVVSALTDRLGSDVRRFKCMSCLGLASPRGARTHCPMDCQVDCPVNKCRQCRARRVKAVDRSGSIRAREVSHQFNSRSAISCFPPRASTMPATLRAGRV